MIQQPHQNDTPEDGQYLDDFRTEAEKHHSLGIFIDFLIDRIRIKFESEEYKDKKTLLYMLEGALIEIETQMNSLVYFIREKYYGADELKARTAKYITRTNDKFRFVAKNLKLILE